MSTIPGVMCLASSICLLVCNRVIVVFPHARLLHGSSAHCLFCFLAPQVELVSKVQILIPKEVEGMLLVNETSTVPQSCAKGRALIDIWGHHSAVSLHKYLVQVFLATCYPELRSLLPY